MKRLIILFLLMILVFTGCSNNVYTSNRFIKQPKKIIQISIIGGKEEGKEVVGNKEIEDKEEIESFVDIISDIKLTKISQSEMNKVIEETKTNLSQPGSYIIFLSGKEECNGEIYIFKDGTFVFADPNMIDYNSDEIKLPDYYRSVSKDPNLLEQIKEKFDISL